MRIFNNFDTNYQKKELELFIQKYGEEKVLLVKRNFFYLLLFGIFPFLFLCFLCFIIFLVDFKLFKNIPYVFWSVMGVLVILGIVLLHKIILIFIDYLYDFTIISPKGIFTYKQEGFFKCDSKDLPAEEIRSIVASRKGFLGNVFGYGIIEIYTDLARGELEIKGVGRSQAGKTKLTYVNKPNRVKEKILELCGKN